MRSRPITIARAPLPRLSVTFSASCRQQLMRKKLVSPSVHWSPWRMRGGDGQAEVGHGGAVGGEAELGVVGEVADQGDGVVGGHGVPSLGLEVLLLSVVVAVRIRGRRRRPHLLVS
jgi:hypothetical protein